MKVLIISHNPISTYQSMGKTFLSLFSEFHKEELCQLYIYPTIPDIDVCSSYYRITDKDILKSYFHFGKVSSREIKNDEIDSTKHEKFENQADEKLYNKKKSYFTILARDLLWRCSRKFNNDLQEWIARENPTCIFLAPGEAKFIYEIAMKISEKYRIPICTYVCDEFYFVRNRKEIMGKIQLYMLKNKIEKLMHSTNMLIAICDELNIQYSKKFNIPATTIMTGGNMPTSESEKISKKASSITFLGNLAYKRDESIADIGRALDIINDRYNTQYTLKLYTKNLTDVNKKNFNNIKSIQYCGYVTGKDFVKAFNEAHILLHVESFDEECIDRVKNSVSTKIPDSLGGGIPLLAYGPDSVASISYLKKNQCACVITKKTELEEKLIDIFSNEEKRRKYAIKGIEIANMNHCSSENSRRLHRILEKI